MLKPLLLASPLVFGSIYAPTQSVHVDLIDGKTGRTLYIECALFSTGDKTPPRVAFMSGPSGLDVPSGRSEYLQITGAGPSQERRYEYGQCSDENCKFSTTFTSVLVSDIMAKGANLGEVTDQLKRPLQPGILRVYIRKASAWQKILDRLYS